MRFDGDVWGESDVLRSLEQFTDLVKLFFQVRTAYPEQSAGTPFPFQISRGCPEGPRTPQIQPSVEKKALKIVLAWAMHRHLGQVSHSSR